ncbi:DUF2934 domain-containing protein [Mesorhizobium sp. M5C.F.Cr.IN.023.01.1.1]|uniref:DUF2934 domain-containing protein n=1 Tax=Mesorhizobium sp. M5C.F.Cr.IN.023.01.1.1 TaxID=2496768 RepID=UPI000FCB380B|nr:DUF2934 domain-containing protein [Mesorhizobium sp. M5C.F.Cr.IN.023.01.1.1]RUV70509.1 DUF2934 domain-containing protein [Mesorhizobium sp. M5C.F.Cr.IN.023.01.1.1]
MDDRIERIRQRAHEIWEREGRPDGREQEHWERATKEIDVEDGQSSENAQNPDAASTATGSPSAEQVTGAGPQIAERSKDSTPKRRPAKPQS